jgi:hypothetical protein
MTGMPGMMATIVPIAISAVITPTNTRTDLSACGLRSPNDAVAFASQQLLDCRRRRLMYLQVLLDQLGKRDRPAGAHSRIILCRPQRMSASRTRL